jgi:transcriptional regulator with XRE-family HTH domain
MAEPTVNGARDEAPGAAATFGDWLSAAMRQRELSQAELARRIGVDDAQVSRWRRGLVVPSVGHLQRIAAALDVPRVLLDRLAGYPVPEEADLLLPDAPPADPTRPTPALEGTRDPRLTTRDHDPALPLEADAYALLRQCLPRPGRRPDRRLRRRARRAGPCRIE